MFVNRVGGKMSALSYEEKLVVKGLIEKQIEETKESYEDRVIYLDILRKLNIHSKYL